MFVVFVGFLVREGGLEPPIPKRELDPKSSAFANFATLAQRILIFCKRDNIVCFSCRKLQESATKNPGALSALCERCCSVPSVPK